MVPEPENKGLRTEAEKTMPKFAGGQKRKEVLAMESTQLALHDVCGPLTDLIKKLSGDDGEQWLFALKRFNRKEDPWAKQEVAKPKSPLLQLVTTVDLPAVDTFSAKEHFEVGEVDSVKIGWIGDDFKNNFSEKTESNVQAATLRVHKLRRRSVNGPIIAELGGEAVAETALAQMWELLEPFFRIERG